ncbi:HECT-domain-containing protein [Pseudocohnilembus persalinus]|uniref:HECT-type E3 ubiquitin transferase n=1 Tax=Pseudocohnilembus persalinus TaxID=266149 RepID=A0A0V0QP31_PSEPJ|nr:HECT-domain-containing protein [Pseudocohnilembus persalinus]|eukprot:KRX03901.1 HECT-domain-containing protein [Pseudocohnilembus persalinus]
MHQKGQQLAFPQKYEIFRSEVEKFRIPWQQGADWVTITKDSVLLSSLMEIQKVNLYKEVKVKIQGEKVEDAGGVLREWAHLIMKEAIDQFSGLFIMADTEDVTYKINNEADNDEHIINCFSLIGKILGKLVFEKVPINIYLDNTILKYLLGQKVELQDIFSYDKQLYKSWKHILDTDIQQDDFIGNFAIYKTDEKGQTHAIELIPNGEAIIIENLNKQQYVDLWQVIPKKLIENFEVHEFEMILNSTPFINIDDWKIHTEYQGKFKENDKIIQWFWEILYSFDQQQLQEFLRYCTGSTRPPIQGFKKLESNRGSYNKFTIRSIPFTKTNPFPIAHTCFNRLELPEYKDQFTMQTYMKAVVNNDLDGVFGME